MFVLKLYGQWRAQDLFQQGQKILLGVAEKKSGGAGAKKISAPPCYFSAPPAEFNSAPGAEQTRRGQKTLLYLEKEGETFNDRSLSNPQLTVLFFVTLYIFSLDRIYSIWYSMWYRIFRNTKGQRKKKEYQHVKDSNLV